MAKSKKFTFLIFGSVLLFSLTSVLYAVDSTNQDQTPNYYYYQGERIELELDRSRVAVLYTDQSSSTERAMIYSKSKYTVASESQIDDRNWSFLELNNQLPDVAASSEIIKSLAASTEVKFASPVFKGYYHGWMVITQDILIKIKTEHLVSANEILNEIAPKASTIEENVADITGVYKIRSVQKNGYDVLSKANQFALDPRIEWAEPDAKISGKESLIPNDTYFSNVWGIYNIGQAVGTFDVDMDGELAWDITTGVSSIKVLIIDVGVQQDHPDINQFPGSDFTNEIGNGGPLNECDNHGTAVAGCVSATINNNLGTVGIAPTCKSVSARTFISNIPCNGGWSANYSWTADALAWAEAQGVQVTNNSNYYGSPSSIVTAKYQSTYDNGMVHFASAGNDAEEGVGYPASLTTVNAVSAIDRNGNLASFSNWGAQISFSAPGVSVFTTDRTGSNGYENGDYVWANGTSFASPYAAGVAALVLSVEPSLTAPEVEEKMRCAADDYGDPGFDYIYGYGFVNAYNSISLPWADSDGDSFNDPCDNCPADFNPVQEDADNDGIGDLCDECTDTDGDGYGDEGYAANTCILDNCVDIYNPDQDDPDNDGVGTPCDNCPTINNPTQADSDNDEIGDACDINYGSILLDHVDGEAVPFAITANKEITFYLRFENSTNFYVTGSTNGFRLYSPDNAVWNSTSGAVTGSITTGMYDGGLFVNTFSPDGIGSDTIGFGGFKIFMPGIPDGFNEIFASITIGPIDIANVGKTICIDSSFYPPVSSWEWSVIDKYAPTWDGPYCYIVTESCCALRGDVDNNGERDISDLTYYVAFMFGGGPEAPCFDEGDVDNTGEQDISDLTFIVDYMFGGGPEPSPCF